MTSQERSSRLLRYLPSSTVVGIVCLGAILVAITLAKGLQDPDLFWHITTGELIVSERRVPSTDPFSFTWLGRPWTPHEWLSELAIYGLIQGIGLLGALTLFGLVAPLALAILAFSLRRNGASALAIMTCCGLSALVMVPYLTIRPQAISWLLLAVLIGYLSQLRPERPALALWLIPLFILWANLHGLYVIGLGVLALYTLFTIFGATVMRSRRGWIVAVFGAALASSMLTPAGPIGILYPLRYINAGDWGLANIQEWQSPDFHDPAHLALLALILAIAANGGRATPGWLSALAYIGVVMSLLAMRNAPIAAVFALPTLALGITDRLAKRTHKSDRPLSSATALPRRLMEISIAGVIAIAAFLILVPEPIESAIDVRASGGFPVEAIDHLERIDPDSRVLAEYGWGGYVIHQLYDHGGRIFVDGRNDMYDEAILNDYSAIRAADQGWSELVDSYGVEAMLFPPERTITRGPALLEEWCEAYRDETQVLLLRECPDG